MVTLDGWRIEQQHNGPDIDLDIVIDND